MSRPPFIEEFGMALLVRSAGCPQAVLDATAAVAIADLLGGILGARLRYVRAEDAFGQQCAGGDRLPGGGRGRLGFPLGRALRRDRLFGIPRTLE